MVRIPFSLRNLFRRSGGSDQSPAMYDTGAMAAAASEASFDIAPDDPFLAYLQGVVGTVEIDEVDLESPALDELREDGVKLVVPLVSQGELIGLLNLGPRLSEADYSTDDRRLLSELAGHAAPAVQVAQLVRQQEAEVRARERLEQELRVAQMIQQQFLPKELPKLQGWQFSAFYRPARSVGGDFYDFIELSDGRLALVAGDVSDKGVPAALVMASTRSMLRGEITRTTSPAEILRRVNDLLFADTPPSMFATCFFGILDPTTGDLCFANAGHNLPYLRTGPAGSEVTELHATGMPLGMLPGMSYEEYQAKLVPGASVLFHSDGLVEARDATGQILGFERLRALVARLPEDGLDMLDSLLGEFERFTHVEDAIAEQDDDITLVVVRRAPTDTLGDPDGQGVISANGHRGDDPLFEFDLPSVPGNERLAIQQVSGVIEGLGLSSARLEQLKTAVAEATMNAIEHGNHNQPELMVTIRVRVSSTELIIEIVDQGGANPIPEPEAPDIDAKLAGLQSPRGWGLFLIKNMVDDLRVRSDGEHQTVELVMKLGSEQR